MVPEAERLEMLAYQRPVDLIYLKDDDEPRWALIKAVAPDVLVLTEDHSYSEAEQEELLEIVGRDRGRRRARRRSRPPSASARCTCTWASGSARSSPRSLPGPDRRHPAPAMKAVVAYIPVLHEGYRRFLHAHARDGRST